MQLSATYQLVIDAWRASTTLHDIGEVVERVASLLAPGTQADALTLWRVSRDGRQSEVLATSQVRPQGPGSLRMPARELSEGAVRAWRDMTAVGVAFRLVPGRGPLHGVFAPESGGGEGVVVPLHDSRSLLAAAVLWFRQPASAGESAASLLSELAAPLDAALQLHNERDAMSREREALEADRRALLQRLERDDVSDALIGSDSGLRDVITRAEQVAPTDAPVLLFGETGAGKEVIARLIHRRSRRAGGPIVRVNCGAIPHGLIDSELFGHEKGAFTGAIASRKGWFERADGGTLFLDEVGELPLDAQVRLLRILQDGVFERVGAQRSLKVDVRIVAATHRDLQGMVDAGRFREDLWYRLSVFPIDIPPLRDRPEDIPALATHFAERAGMRIGGSRLALSPADIEALVSYAWPGNVRELAAVIERAVILGDGKRLQVGAALGAAATREAQRAAASADAEPWHIAPLAEAMARHIERALKACHGQVEGKGGAAALLRINPHTLRSRMRKLGIDVRSLRAAPADR